MKPPPTAPSKLPTAQFGRGSTVSAITYVTLDFPAVVTVTFTFDGTGLPFLSVFDAAVGAP